MKLAALLIGFTLQFSSVAQEVRPAKTNPAFLNQGHDWADSVLATMSLDEKIGQLIMIDAFTRPDIDNTEQVFKLIKQFHLGGVIFFAGSPNVQIGHTNRFQAAAKIPLLIAIDGENGAGFRLDSAVSYPFNMALGAIQDHDLIYQWGRVIGSELRSIGVHMNFAPVVDVNNNPANPIISWRSFSDDPSEVARYGELVVRGMQDMGILATAKHFPGHGDTDIDSHVDLPVLPFDRSRLDSVELVPFKHLINAGVGAVMTAHMDIPTIEDQPNIPTTLSKKFTTDILKDQLGFKGLIITDALNMKGVTKYHNQESIGVKALLAGNDMLLYPANIDSMIAGIKKAIKNKTLPISLLDEKCQKILLAKYWFGLNVPQNRFVAEKWRRKGEEELMQRKLVEQSITVLKNEHEIIPLKRIDMLRVASLSISSNTTTPFQSRLADYMPMAHYNLSKDASLHQLDSIGALLNDYNLLIIGLHKGQKFPWSTDTYSAHIYTWIAGLAVGKKVILANFRNPVLLEKVQETKLEALVTAYQDDPVTEDYAAQLIFGGIGARGRLSLSVPGHWERGAGVDTDGGVRFKYTIPEELGLSGDSLDAKITAVMHNAIAQKAFPGGQVFLAKDKKVFYHKSFGYHTYSEESKLLRDDIFDLASVTKVTATTAGLMKLHDQNQFALDAPLKNYFPYLKHSNKKDIEVRPLLAHQARIKSWIPYYQTTKKKNGKYKRKTLAIEPSVSYSYQLSDNLYLHYNYQDKIFKMIKKSKLEPGAGYLYSDLPFYLFYEYLDRVTDKGMLAMLDDQFYRPLGASTLTYNPLNKFPKERIVPTEKDTYFRNTQLHGVVHDEGAAMMDGVSGHAGLFGTANDLAKMWQMYLDFGQYGGERYLSAATLRKFAACQYCEQGNRRGLAFDKPDIKYDAKGSSVAKAASCDTFGHSGYTGTLVWADPAYNLLYIFLSNRVYPTRESRGIYTLNVRPTIHNIVYDEMLRNKK